MDDLDREILNEIQWTFPLVQRPYDTLAEKYLYAVMRDSEVTRLIKQDNRCSYMADAAVP